MKRILFLLLIVISSKVQAQVYINPGVDTADFNIKKAVNFYTNYMNDFKGKKLPVFSKYWSEADYKKYKIPDPGIYGIAGDYPTYSMAESKTIYYAKPLKNGTILLKTIGGNTDSLKMLDVLYISNNYIVKDAKQQLHFITPVEHNKNNWLKQKVRNITFRYQKSHIFNKQKADSLINQVKNLEKQWNLQPIEIEYFFADTYEEIQLIRGLEFTFGLGNKDKPTGISNDIDNIIYSAGNGENYFHEFVHIYLNKLHPKSPLNEGLAMFYGGSLGQPLQWHIARLKTYLNKHNKIDLNKLADFYYMDNFTNPDSAIKGMLCNIVFKKDGMIGLKRLVTYETMNEVFEKEFKFNLKNLNEELRALINKQ